MVTTLLQRRWSSIILNLFLSFSSCFCNNFRDGKKGFLIIPKKVEQNQTKIFDRDKLSIGNYTVPNSISDASKNLNTFKSLKNTLNSSSGLGDGLSLANSTNNNSSNQLPGASDAELTTFFSTANFTNITSQVGSIVEVPCTVHHLGEGTVSVEHRQTNYSTFMCEGRKFIAPLHSALNRWEVWLLFVKCNETWGSLNK